MSDDKSTQLRESITTTGDATQYSPAVMQNKALLMYAESDLDSLYDVEKDQIPFIAYLRALNEKLPIPGTMAFLQNQLSLSRSKDRQGRREFGQALNKQPVIVSNDPTSIMALRQEQPEKEGFLSKLLFKRKKQNEGT